MIYASLMGQKHERKRGVTNELVGLDMGDPRRETRALLMAERLAHSPGSSIPDAMLTEAEVEGAYLHLSSPHVTLNDILAPHVAQTRARVLEAGLAYVAHDTTECTFGGETRRKGLGPVNGQDQGFLAHLSLAVSADQERVPFGLLAVGTRIRKSVGKPSGNESKKWSLGIEQASTGIPKEVLVHVADRESDIFALVVECLQNEHRFIFRAAQDRAILSQELGPEAVTRLFAAARAAQSLVEVEAEVSARGARKRPTKELRRFPVRRARKAHLAYSALTVELKRPGKATKAQNLPDTVRVNVVRAWEPNPPEGEQPVEWILLTNECIATPDDIRPVVEGYRTRWLIEEFNKSLKSGCGYEDAQLESAHALFNLLGYCAIIAYMMLLMRALSRSNKKLPPSHFFTPAQLACLHAVSSRERSNDPTLEEALLATAALGGHLKRNGLPGWKTISRGYSRLLEYERGYLIAQKALSCAQS